jgi:predicted secreted protein
MEKKKIILVSHCLLNTATKVNKVKAIEETPEEQLRKAFLTRAIQDNIQVVQLPCPEYKLYGCKRWGHTKDQFNHPHFKQQCREMLGPFIEDLKSFIEEKERFVILGFVGIDGSPSCGVNFTCKGKWGGEMMSNTNLQDTLSTIYRCSESGVMIEVFSELLKDANIEIPFYGLDGTQPEMIMQLLE